MEGNGLGMMLGIWGGTRTHSEGKNHGKGEVEEEAELW